MYWCFHCYARNASSEGPCERCGREIKAPASLSYDERLIWALRHPDGDRAMIAARLLGERGARQAILALNSLIEQDRDPFLAARALRSLIEIEGPDAIREPLVAQAESGSFLAARVATEGLGRLGAG
jgi:HEAT repeat protein